MGQDEDFLRAFGERLRRERERRGMSRKLLAEQAGVSERYVTQIESGKGNVSIVILRQIAAALGISLAKLVETDDAGGSRSERIALIGLRGAGKSTLGAALAKARNVPFFELDREIERLSGTSLGTLIEMYGQPAYRRYELQALQELLDAHPHFVVATSGGLVSEPVTYDLLLRHCLTIWVRTTPEQHMARVIAQGDRRPMSSTGAGSAQAMQDLRRILAERIPLYERADLTVDTTGATVKESIGIIVPKLALRMPA
jgi:XRE family aerobic/anaerobic benzoate catabolism transcriptional regulator